MESINKYSQTYPCDHLYFSVTCIKRLPFLGLSKKISYELNPNLRGHLS